MTAEPAAPKPAPKPKPKPAPRGFDKGAFYRTSRMLHAYFSAFAFLTLIFFTITGIMLNHPEWFDAFKPVESKVEVSLEAQSLLKARTADDPGKAIAELVAAKIPVKGNFSSADISGEEAILRWDGPKGTTDGTIDLATGKGELTIGKASVMLMTQDLHRGKNSGLAWKWLIDISGYLILILSIIGYVLFFSLRFRLKTSLILTGVSLAAMMGIILFFVH